MARPQFLDRRRNDAAQRSSRLLAEEDSRKNRFDSKEDGVTLACIVDGGLCLIAVPIAISAWLLKKARVSAWYQRRYNHPFTVSYNYGVPNDTERESLKRVNGYWTAQNFGELLIKEHPSGSYTILDGHQYWPDELKREMEESDA